MLKKVTSAEAAKLLKKLEEERNTLLTSEMMTSSFVAAVEEDVEKVRPEYDFAATQKALLETEEKIRKLKHALNLFNSKQTVDGFDMTIDQMLVYLPQLSNHKKRLAKMAAALPMTRVRSSGYMSNNSRFIEYQYANYDIKQVTEEYEKADELLSRAQTALDKVNSTVTFEIDL